MHKNLSIAVGAALVMALAGCADDSEPAGAAITAAPDRATTDAARWDLGRVAWVGGR